VSNGDSHHAHIVIGGGISGVTAAHYAQRAGIDTLLLESGSRLGGCMHTHAFPELDGYWVEGGSHSCFNSYGNLLAIMEALDLLSRATAKEKQGYRLWRGGERKSILSALHPVELAVSLPGLLLRDKSRCSVAEYYGRGLGKRNYRDLFGPAFRSVICQPADDYPAEALFRKKPRRKDVLRSFTMPDGLAEIPTRIAERTGFGVETDKSVSAVAAADSGFALSLADGSERTCGALTLAVPPDVAARLLAGVAADAASVIEPVGVAEIDTLVLAFRAEDLAIEPLAGLISIDGGFYSAVSRDFLSDSRYRGFAFHFPGDSVGDETQLAAACRALDTSPDKVAALHRLRNRLPRLRKGHQQLVERLDQALAGRRIAVTGNWFLGVSIEDCVTRSRSEHERLFGPPQSR